MLNLNLIPFIRIQWVNIDAENWVFFHFLILITGIIRAYRESRDDRVSLNELKFFVGDHIDLTIITNFDK